MKSYLIPLAFLSLVTLSTSHAEVIYANDDFAIELSSEAPSGETPVPANLKLVGSGIEDKETGNSIALACVGAPEADLSPGCDRIRYVQFNFATKAASFFGREMKVDNLEKTLKTLKKDFKEYLSEKHHIGLKRSVGAMTIGIVGVYTISAASTLIVAPAGVAALVCLIISDRPVMSGSSHLTSAMLNQDGWNWSSRPKRISAKRFQELTEYIRTYLK